MTTTSQISSILKRASVTALLGLAASSVHADEGSDAWRFTVLPYLWVPGIDASAKVPSSAGLPGEPVFPITKTNVLNALDSAFMGAFEARKGDWSIYGDFNYAALSFHKQGPIAQVIQGKVDFNQSLFELAGARRFWSDSNGSHFDGFLGARYIEINSDVTLTLGNSQFKYSADRNDTDAIVGIKGETRFGADSKWFVPYYGDIGGGSSNHSWLATLGLGYAYGWGDLSLNYRYFEFDPGRTSPIKNVRMYGPTLAFGFHF